jgi:hypothetical protein
MAEFCKECFKRSVAVPSDGITDDMLMMSAAWDICEGCGEYKQVVVGVESKFKSFIKDPLHIDDVVVYLKNTRTGSSTIRKCVFVGQITGFTKSKVKIMQLSKEDQWVYPEECYPYGEVTVHPEDVICTMWRSKRWKEVGIIGENIDSEG